LPGAEISTLPAPASRCGAAPSFDRKTAGAFEHDVDAELAPRQPERIALDTTRMRRRR